jgi:hypothetical protein
MLQEISRLNRLAEAVAAAERADKRLIEKPLNDLITEIKVRGLIAKMVLVTAKQTLRALPMAREFAGVEAAVVVPIQIQTPEPPHEPPVLTKTRKQRGRKLEQTPVYLTHPHLPLSERFLMYKLPLSPQQVADEVDVVLDTAYRWIRAGTLPSRPAGRFHKCDQGPLADWAKKREFLPADQRGEVAS